MLPAELLLLLLLFTTASPITASLHLVVDPSTVAQTTAKVVFGPVDTLSHPLLSQDRPWEAAWLNTNPTVSWEPAGKKVLLWYNTLSQCPDGMYPTTGMCPHPGYPAEWRASSNHEQRSVTCLAESADGLTGWLKPSLGVVAWNGSKANNIVVDAGNADGNRGVYFDPHEPNVSRRFKLFGSLNTTDNATFCSWSARTVSTAMSADGVHWHDIRNVSGEIQVAADTANSVIYDESLGKYLAFTRRHCNTEFPTPPWCTGNATEYGVRREVRSISLTPDFGATSWAYGKEVAHGLANDELYSLVPWRSSSWRAGLYFAVASYYQREPAGHVTCELVMSGDYGQNWIRLAPHQQFIPLGKNGSWNSHTCFSANGLVMPSTRQGLTSTSEESQGNENNEVRFYFAGGNGQHSGGGPVPGRNNFIGLATATEHALAGLTAAADGAGRHVAEAAAVIVTVPMPLPNGATDLWVLLRKDNTATAAEPTLTVTISGTTATGIAHIAEGKVTVMWNATQSPLIELRVAVLHFSVPPGMVMFAFGFAEPVVNGNLPMARFAVQYEAISIKSDDMSRGPVHPVLPLPTAAQLRWHKGGKYDGISALVHYNMASFFKDGDPGCTPQIWIGANGSSNPASFAPSDLDTDDWASAMKPLGIAEAVLVAKYGCGFAIWPTEVKLPDGRRYPYRSSVDVLGQFAASMQKVGIGHGFYYSFSNNFFLNKLGCIGGCMPACKHYSGMKSCDLLPGQIAVTNREWEVIAQAQVAELWTKYNNLTEICKNTRKSTHFMRISAIRSVFVKIAGSPQGLTGEWWLT